MHPPLGEEGIYRERVGLRFFNFIPQRGFGNGPILKGKSRKSFPKTVSYITMGLFGFSGNFDLDERIIRAVELNNPEYQLKAVNNTFHGRDTKLP